MSDSKREQTADAIAVGAQIRSRRQQAAMRISDLARRCGVAKPTAHGWEGGLYVPRPAMLRKLAEVFGCSVDDLLSGVAIPQVEIEAAAAEVA